MSTSDLKIPSSCFARGVETAVDLAHKVTNQCSSTWRTCRRKAR